MGKYTEKNSDKHDQRIDADLQLIVQESQKIPKANMLVALVLLGGYGRGEGTPLEKDGKAMPFNDYDLIAVTRNCLPNVLKQLKFQIHKLAERLTQKIGVPIDLYLHTERTLKRAEFSLLNYELKNGHIVIWGKKDILSLMPDYIPEEMPLVEGTRLMLNRGRLLLDNKRVHALEMPSSKDEVVRFIKYIWKMHLAFGDCALMASNMYNLYYSKKRESIKKCNDSIPDKEWLINVYDQAIYFKETGDYDVYGTDNLEAIFERCRTYFYQFFLWFEGYRLVGRPFNSIDSYVDSLGKQSDVQVIKCLVLNLLYFKLKSIQPSINWLTVHPRTRLFPSLYLLLQEQVNGHAQTTLTKLLGVSSVQDATRRFYALAFRFS